MGGEPLVILLGFKLNPAKLLTDACNMREPPAKLEEFTAFFFLPGSELRDTFESSGIIPPILTLFLAAPACLNKFADDFEVLFCRPE